MAIRIGSGYDVHALAPDRPLILGGITIPSERGLSGHSDADVLVRATNAGKIRQAPYSLTTSMICYVNINGKSAISIQPSLPNTPNWLPIYTLCVHTWLSTCTWR